MPPTTAKPGLTRKALDVVIGLVRRAGGLIADLLGLARHQQVTELRQETARLGSAAVESTAYLDVDLKRIEESLRELREEVSTLRRLVEEGAVGDEAQLTSPPDRG
jgi:hypothetical protein